MVQVENELIEELTIHPIEIRRLQLELPEGSKTSKVRRLKRIAGESVCLESNHMPTSFKERFTKDELTNVPFLKLLGSETSAHTQMGTFVQVQGRRKF